MQVIFQDAASPLMENFLFFHDHTMMLAFIISALVLYIMITVTSTILYDLVKNDSQAIEILWTISPAFVLVIIAVPSIRILYLSDEILHPYTTIKAIGHQWYWSYEYSDYLELNYDGYIIPTTDLLDGNFRLLETDTRVVVPSYSFIRILISADDVIHAWTVPALGSKVDGVPGRLNQTSFITARTGLYYGQCSEICGANHSFIPIVVEAVPLNHVEKWITLQLEESSLRSFYGPSTSLLSWKRCLPTTLNDMPQLNPIPWFSIALFTWLLFALIIIPKVCSHSFPNTPSTSKTSTHTSSPWSWPWL